MKTKSNSTLQFAWRMTRLISIAFISVTILNGCGDGDGDAPTPAKGLAMDVTDRFVPSGDMTLDHLRLKKGSSIATMGRDVKITVTELESDEGVIETFPPASAAAPSQPGRNGGKITIVAQRASGKLVVRGTGQNGGPGISGDNGIDGKPGAQGNPGDWKANPIIFPFWPFAKAFEVQMRLNPRPPSDPLWNLRIGNEQFYVCAVAPGNGNTGGNGAYGGDGGQAGNGGNSASVTVLITENSNFNVDLDVRPGVGGSGGRGGAGGKGAAGGPPGQRDQGYRCGTAAWGAKGADGPSGRPGKDGVNGIAIPSCVKIGDQYSNCPQG